MKKRQEKCLKSIFFLLLLFLTRKGYYGKIECKYTYITLEKGCRSVIWQIREKSLGYTRWTFWISTNIS